MSLMVPVDSIPFIFSTETEPTPIQATTAVAGAPGSWLPFGAVTPANFLALAGITASPSTPWTTGQYVRLGNGTTAHWQGVGWAAGIAGAPVSTGGMLLVDFDTPGIGLEWMTGTDEKARYVSAEGPAIVTDIAQRFDVVVALGNHLRTHTALMRQVNPNIFILAYQLGPFASLGEAGLTAATSWDEIEFAHTGPTMTPPNWAGYAAAVAAGATRIEAMRANKGNRILTTDPFETWLMDAGQPAWRTRAAERARTVMAGQGAHGVLLDSMGQGAMRVGYVDGAAWNRAIGAPYTNTEWNAASAEQTRIVRGAGASRIFTAINGIGDQGAFPATKVIGYEADLAMAERTLRNPEDLLTAWPTAAELKGTIDMTVDMEANSKVGGGLAWCTKLWTVPQPTVAQQKAWYEYAQAAFMCATNGKSRMFFIKDGQAPAKKGFSASNLADQPSPVLNIGTPTGPYTQVGSAFRRVYTNGLAAVNGPAAAVTITLPAGPYTRSDTGATVTGSITLPANTGVILTKV